MCVKKKQWKDFFFNLLFRDFLQQLGWAKRNWKPDGGFNAELKLDQVRSWSLSEQNFQFFM